MGMRNLTTTLTKGPLPMLSPLRRPLLALTAAAIVAGCSCIGEVNGVPVNRDATMSSQSEPASFCARQPAVCILGGVVAVGVIAAVATGGGDGAVATGGGDGAVA